VGYTSSLISPSLNTFFLPKRSPHGFYFKKELVSFLKSMFISKCLIERVKRLNCSGSVRNCSIALPDGWLSLNFHAEIYVLVKARS
jgi:hypothetical protein